MLTACRRGIGALLLALGTLLISLSVIHQASGSDRFVAWCFDREHWHWLGYSEGVPGSVSQDALTDCLEKSAERGEIRSIRGEVIDHGLLLDAGQGAIYWPSRVGHRVSLDLTAFDDRITLTQACAREAEIRSSRPSITASGRVCDGIGQMLVDEREVSDADFTIYFASRSFVIDGEDGWFHVGYSRESVGDGYPERWGEIRLYDGNPGIWLMQAHATQTPAGIQIRYQSDLIAESTGPAQEANFNDWYQSIRRDLILGDSTIAPFEFSGQGLLPDREAYVNAAQELIDAIVEDLFRDVGQPVRFVMLTSGRSSFDVKLRTVSISTPSTTEMLLNLVGLIMHPEKVHNPKGAAMFLELLDRYIPGFSKHDARVLAGEHSVIFDFSIDLEPESARTRFVRELLTQRAPALLFDFDQTPGDLFLGLAEFQVGTHYTRSTIIRVPTCEVPYQDLHGWTTHAPALLGRFTVGNHRLWNGLELRTFHGATSYGLLLEGTPNVEGQVRIEVGKVCTDDVLHDARLMGYVEVIVRPRQVAATSTGP